MVAEIAEAEAVEFFEEIGLIGMVPMKSELEVKIKHDDDGQPIARQRRSFDKKLITVLCEAVRNTQILAIEKKLKISTQQIIKYINSSHPAFLENNVSMSTVSRWLSGQVRRSRRCLWVCQAAPHFVCR
jgi:hypothetical protein